MITGKLYYDINIEVTNEKQLQDLSSRLSTAIKQVQNVADCEEVDSDLDDDGDDE